MELDGGVLILRGGLVVDPRAGTERVADVVVDGGQVVAVETASPGERERHPQADVIDVTGLVVGPGFVDVHSHVHSIAGQRLQALDGVTTTLDLEAGLMPLETAYARAADEGRPLHYGFSASWGDARARAHLGTAPTADLNASLAMLGDPEWQRTSSPSERAVWLDLLESELAAGALGIGVLMGYAPRSDPAEFLAVARLAAATGTGTFTHVREILEADPTTPIDGSSEITRAAAETGARMHHCHVNSTSRRHVDRVLGVIESARANGSPVTVETYPYGAGSTAIGAYFLAPERLPAWGLRPTDISLVATGERVADLRRLEELRVTDPGAVCVVRFLDEDDPSDAAMLHPFPGLPGRHRRQRRDARAVARRLDRLTRVAPSPRRSDTSADGWDLCPLPAPDGPRVRRLDLGRGLPALLLPAGAAGRRLRALRARRRVGSTSAPTPTSSSSTRPASPTRRRTSTPRAPRWASSTCSSTASWSSTTGRW